MKCTEIFIWMIPIELAYWACYITKTKQNSTCSISAIVLHVFFQFESALKHRQSISTPQLFPTSPIHSVTPRILSQEKDAVDFLVHSSSIIVCILPSGVPTSILAWMASRSVALNQISQTANWRRQSAKAWDKLLHYAIFKRWILNASRESHWTGRETPKIIANPHCGAVLNEDVWLSDGTRG